MKTGLLIYGAYGYTGELIAREAVQRGHMPVLAGRDRDKVTSLARELKLEPRSFSLDKPATVANQLADIAVVLHCAGPFGRTAAPMVEACLATGTHYLDITGEIPVFEMLAGRDAEAVQAGIMLLPGVGFDVVPSDCLARYLAEQLPSATQLTLAFKGLGGLSRGTALTMLEGLRWGGGAVRQQGHIVSVPAGHRTLSVDFGHGPQPCLSIPWGDVSSAYYSTGIPNIEVYMAFPKRLLPALRLSRPLSWLLRLITIQRLARRFIDSRPPGPDAISRERGRSYLWGRVSDGTGNRFEAKMETPEGYKFTSLSALHLAEKALSGHIKPGFQTASSAYGADLVLEIEGVSRSGIK